MPPTPTSSCTPIGSIRHGTRPLASAFARWPKGWEPWAIAWPCLHEFYAVVTHPRIYRPPSTHVEAVAQIEAWMTSPRLVLLAENDGYWNELRRLLDRGRVVGPIVHDARVAALCLLHGVREFWSADKARARIVVLQ